MKLIDILVRELPKSGGWPEGADFVVQDGRDGRVKFGRNPIEVGLSAKWSNEVWQGEWNFSTHNDFICHEISSDWHAILTREQYEAALASSKPECDADVIPAIIGRFVPSGGFNCGLMPFNVLTKVASDFMPPAWEGVREGGEEYHVIESAWRFESVEWDGEGLPPVGCECEARYRSERSEWALFRCVATEQSVAFGWNGDEPVILIDDLYEFRPIRSEADKKRDEAIKAMASAPKPCGHPIVGVCSEIYDAIAAGKIPHIRID